MIPEEFRQSLAEKDIHLPIIKWINLLSLLSDISGWNEKMNLQPLRMKKTFI